MQHERWHWTPEQGASVSRGELYLIPVDPVIYCMNDVWGFDEDGLPCEPFDIEIKVQGENVLQGLKLFETAVKEHLSQSLHSYATQQYLEKLIWKNTTSEIKSCQVVMSG